LVYGGNQPPELEMFSNFKNLFGIKSDNKWSLLTKGHNTHFDDWMLTVWRKGKCGLRPKLEKLFKI